MEANKDTARAALELAKRKLVAGELDEARRLGEKSLRLFPTPEAESFLATLASAPQRPPPRPDTPSSTTDSNPETPRPRPTSSQPKPSRPAAEPSRAPTTTRPHTPEQAALAQRINKAQSYYEVLGIEKRATEEQINSARKKLIMQLHPDKNSAPGAAEAFKKVDAAFTCLSDRDSRQEYDIHGVDTRNQGPQAQPQHYAHEFHQGFHGQEFDPEDLFAAFFGGHPGMHHRFAQQQQQRRRRQPTERREQRQQQQDGGVSIGPMLFQMLPLLLLLLLSVVSAISNSGGGTEAPPYRFSPASSHPIHRVTRNLGVDYYVKPAFESEYYGQLSKLTTLEKKIEEDYRTHLRNSCNQERQQKDYIATTARSLSGQDRLHAEAKANTFPMPFCNLMNDFERQRSY